MRERRCGQATIRIILVVAVLEDFLFYQMKVKATFLHGELNETIYISASDGVAVWHGV